MNCAAYAFRVILLVAVVSLHGYCQLSSFPFVQQFDTVEPPAIPVGWISSQNKTPGLNDATTSATAPHSLPNAVVFTNATVSQSLSSPSLDFSGLVPDRIMFSIRWSASFQARMVVEASVDGGGSFSVPVGDTLGNIGVPGYVLSSFRIPGDLAGRAGVVFRWRVVPDTAGKTATLRIDDVSITVKRLYDLELARLNIEPPLPLEGDGVVARTLVRNLGEQEAETFRIEMFLDRNNDTLPDPSELVGTTMNVYPLAVQESVSISIPLGIASAGSRRLIGRLVFELDEDTSNNRTYAQLTVGYRAGSVVVNEIMYAPLPTEPEWIELFNIRGDSLLLKNWSISDAVTSSKHVFGGDDVWLTPKGYVVLTKDSAALVEGRAMIASRVISVPGFPALNNNGDIVLVRDERGCTMDSVQYLSVWGGSEGGRSLERVDPFAESNSSGNWVPSEDSSLATPGRINSVARLDRDLRIASASVPPVAVGENAIVSVTVHNDGRLTAGSFHVVLYHDRNRDTLGSSQELLRDVGVDREIAPGESLVVCVAWTTPPPGAHVLLARIDYPLDQRPSNNGMMIPVRVGFADRTLIINEMMYEPLPGSAEYIEVMNRSDQDVDLAHWVLQVRGRPTEVGARVMLSESKRILHSGELFVLASDSSIFRSFPILEARCTEVMKGTDLHLSNDGGDIIIKDCAGCTIDSVAYQWWWHNPAVVDRKGRSLEKISPELRSCDGRSWSTCVAPSGGTPGLHNSISVSALPSRSRLSFAPNPFSPDGDGFDDFAVIHYELPVRTSVVGVKIFDVKGRLIRRLASNEPAGPQGELVWDGRDDERRTAPVGVYIVFLEALDDHAGIVLAAKGVLVLAGKF